MQISPCQTISDRSKSLFMQVRVYNIIKFVIDEKSQGKYLPVTFIGRKRIEVTAGSTVTFRYLNKTYALWYFIMKLYVKYSIGRKHINHKLNLHCVIILSMD